MTISVMADNSGYWLLLQALLTSEVGKVITCMPNPCQHWTRIVKSCKGCKQLLRQDSCTIEVCWGLSLCCTGLHSAGLFIRWPDYLMHHHKTVPCA